MLRFANSLLFLCFSAATLAAYEPPVTTQPLKSVADLRKFSYAELRLAPPVDLKATVIAHLADGFDAQDASGGIFFAYPADQLPPIGEEVAVQGNVTSGFHGPFVVIDAIDKSGNRAPPKPLNFRPDFVQTGLGDNRWVELSGLLVDVRFGDSKRMGQGLLVTGQSDLVIRFRNAYEDFDVDQLESLVGSSVKLLGSGAPLFNDQRQRIGSEFVCPRTNFVSALTRMPGMTSIPLEEVGRYDSRQTRQGLVETAGTVTLVESPSSLIVQAGRYGARVRTLASAPVQVGDSLTLTGLPETEGYFVGLRYTSLTPSESPVALAAPVADEEPLSHEHAFQVVTLTGRLLEKGRSYINLQVDDALVAASAPAGLTQSLPPEGSELRIRGVKLVDANAKGEVRSVTIALRHADDVEVLAVPSWWTPARLWSVVQVLAIGAFFFLVMLLLLNRRVKKQTALIAEQIESNATLEERNRIARELHDTLSQGFSGVGYQLASVANHLTSDPDKAKNKLATAREMVEQSLLEARESLIGLRIPTGAETLHFPGDTIVAARTRCDEADISLAVDDHNWGPDAVLSPEAAFACHRIVLEAVANALRHSEAKNLSIRFAIEPSETSEKPKQLRIVIADDGVGFSPDEKAPEGHFGLQGMKERAQRLGADLTIQSGSLLGTTVKLTLDMT